MTSLWQGHILLITILGTVHLIKGGEERNILYDGKIVQCSCQTLNLIVQISEMFVNVVY